MSQFESYLSSRPAQSVVRWPGGWCEDVGARHGTARQLLAGWAGAAVTA